MKLTKEEAIADMWAAHVQRATCPEYAAMKPLGWLIADDFGAATGRSTDVADNYLYKQWRLGLMEKMYVMLGRMRRTAYRPIVRPVVRKGKQG